MPDIATFFAGVIAVALLVYALTGGADFGAGFWDLLARGPRARAHRELIAHAIAPIWEANHVWMILVVVLLFVAFPTAFAAIMTALHLPIVFMLIGITLRGAAFVFRAYGPPERAWTRWGTVFAVASTVTPIFLGVIVGAVASGAIRLDARGDVVTDFVSEWLAVFPLAVGVLVLALFVYLAAVYLAVEASDPALRGDFCRRAIGANLALGVVAALAALAAREGAPHLWRELSGSPRALLMQSLIAALAIATIVALRQRRVRLARVLAVAQVSLVVLGWVASQGGDLLVGQRTFAQAAAPDSILWPVAYALAAGSVVLVPAFLVLYMLFKLRPRAS